MVQQQEYNEPVSELGFARQKSASQAPSLLWFYAIWVGLAWFSAASGHSSIDGNAGILLLFGITLSQGGFLLLTRSRSGSPVALEALVAAQIALGIGWTSAYMYFSTNSGDLVLGMYVTVLIYAIFHLDNRSFNQICVATAFSYLVALCLKWVSDPVAIDMIGSTFRFMVLLALVIWGIMFAHRLREIRNELQFRNEELQGVLDRVTRIAERDHLTKSFNRRYIMEVLAREKARADRSDGTFCVCIFDLDHFKMVNDRYGHLIGDRILSDFARRVKSELRGMDTVNPTEYKKSFGRFGGEEFIAVLPATNLDGGHICAERMRESVAAKAFDDRYEITVSVGVAEYNEHESIPQLLSRADEAMYRAKAGGRNMVCISKGIRDEDTGTVPNLRVLK